MSKESVESTDEGGGHDASPTAHFDGAPRSMRADAQRNRRRILAAAREMLSIGTSSSTADICARADVGAGTLYRHFGSRTELMAAVHSEDVDALFHRADELTSSQPPWAALEQWVNEYLAYCQDNWRFLSDLHHQLQREPALNELLARRTEALFERAMAPAKEAQLVDEGLAGADLALLIGGMVLVPGSVDVERNQYRLKLILRGIQRR